MKKGYLLHIIGFMLLTVCAVSAGSYKFAVLCDTRSNTDKNGLHGVNVAAVHAVCRDLKSKGAEFVLAPGDFICGHVSWYSPLPPPSELQFSALLNAAKEEGVGLPGSGAEIILYPARGNHEDYHDKLSTDKNYSPLEAKKKAMQAWLNSIGKSLPQNGPEGEKGFTYWFRKGDELFIGLDEYIHTGVPEKENIRINQPWLDKVLAQEDGYVFVFGHTPAFAAHHTDCLGENPAARDTFLRSIFKRSGVYFCGHDHFYARAAVPVYYPGTTYAEGYMQQVITPSGAPFLSGNRSDNKKWDGVYPDADVVGETYIDNAVGYQLVTVEDDSVTVEFIATLDACTFTLDKKTGVYSYTYKDNWQDWHFAVKDQFTRYRPSKALKAEGRIKVIVDTDMGWDDTLSILYLMKNPAIDILGITVTGCGETHLEDGIQLALALMELGGRDAVVCAGTGTPTALGHQFPKDFRDQMDQLMGLRKTLPKVTRKVDPRPAWDFISETLNNTKDEVVILSLGGYTNLGRMLELHPKTNLDKLKSVYTMGGAVYVDGNIALLNDAQKDWHQGPYYSTNWVAEWNMFVDPVAAKKVFDSAIPITLIPLDACDYVMLDKSFIKTITADDPIATLAKNIFIKKTGTSSEGIPVPIFDPLATLVMAGAMQGSQVHKAAIDILTVDSKVNNTCGRTYIVHDPGRKVCNIVQGVSERRFATAYADVLNLEMKK
ncbi:MAG: hypothetical protein GY765_42425 [bacterium]|nr:hypothetical protein [bacterium]